MRVSDELAWCNGIVGITEAVTKTANYDENMYQNCGIHNAGKIFVLNVEMNLVCGGTLHFFLLQYRLVVLDSCLQLCKLRWRIKSSAKTIRN